MNTRLLVSIVGIVVVLGSKSAFGVYNANMSGAVATVVTYTDSDHILFRMENQPSSHPTCSPNYFAVPAETPADRRKAILARLLTAKATGEVINIGYDSTGACASGYIQAHRIG